MQQKTIQIAYLTYPHQEVSESLQQVVQSAIEASDYAYAPYSNFRVGAAVLLENGLIIKGNNQENAAYPSGLCAERVALFYANANYPDVPVKAIAITAFNTHGMISTPVAPCGSCRQVLLESETRYQQAIKIILIAKDTIVEFQSAADLLPNNFNASYLKA
ncbi:MAG: cytidine deaminase [Bacteroidales bacterium]|nr:cytidine deaminase [Bacteroidales bacterium]